MKALVAYFSASGVTGKAAARLAAAIGAEQFEIVPAARYTKEDLDWTNKSSRSTVEMQDLSCRPATAAKASGLCCCDTVFVGFPVWWGREPSIIDTFLEENDLKGKTIVPFCTSGGGDISGAQARIAELCGASVKPGIRITDAMSDAELKCWAESV